MSPDIILIVGIIIAGFSIPSIVSAFSDRRTPRASAITVVIAGLMIIYALRTHPGGYQLSDLPDVFVRVIAQFI